MAIRLIKECETPSLANVVSRRVSCCGVTRPESIGTRERTKVKRGGGGQHKQENVEEREREGEREPRENREGEKENTRNRARAHARAIERKTQIGKEGGGGGEVD